WRRCSAWLTGSPCWWLATLLRLVLRPRSATTRRCAKLLLATMTRQLQPRWKAMLETTQLQSGYGASQVLFGVDLFIRSGQVVTVLGRNGMGKTTLLKTILGQLPVRGGDVKFDGQSIAGWNPD